MKLGFVSAIVPELPLVDVLKLARDLGYQCVEVMCWPLGKAERRYAGVTHIDAATLDTSHAALIQEACECTGVTLSGLGYYPNPLSPHQDESHVAVNHLKRVFDAAALLGVPVVNTFIGRDPALTVEANWPRFRQVWSNLLDHAGKLGLKVGIENCPMLFSADEWPGGKNLATTPAIWRRMFEEFPTPLFGLNYDPSHLIWQGIDPIAPLREFPSRLVHVHAKDARVDRHRLVDHGVMAFPNLWHTPKLPGMGEVPWGPFFGALAETGYTGPVCVEVEDRAFEGSMERRIQSLKISQKYLSQFIAS